MISIAVLLLGVAQPEDPGIFTGLNERYDNCAATVEIDPEAGRSFAERWLNEGGGDLARYCLAIADLGRGKAKLAAVRLQQLAERSASKQDPKDITSRLYAQTAEAYSAAQYHDEANHAIVKAFEFTPNSAQLQGIAARTYAAAGRWGATEKALTLKEKELPLSSAEHLLRGRARQALGDYKGAGKDTWNALQLNPENIDALVLRGELRQVGIAIDPVVSQ